MGIFHIVLLKKIKNMLVGMKAVLQAKLPNN